MRTRYFVAAQSLRGAIAAYSKRFNFVELSLSEAPNDRALRRWRAAVPARFEFAVRVALTKENLAEKPAKIVKPIISALHLLRSRLVVVSTDRSITPGASTRDALAKLFQALPNDAATTVWEPRGLWEAEAAERAAKDWGVTIAVDPLKDPIPKGNVAYLRVRSLGGVRRASTDSLAKLVREVGDRKEAFVVFESEEALALGKELRRLTNVPKKQTGGMSRVLRPRAALPFKVADDEQE